MIEKSRRFVRENRPSSDRPDNKDASHLKITMTGTHETSSFGLGIVYKTLNLTNAQKGIINNFFSAIVLIKKQLVERADIIIKKKQ